jgi:transcription elongation factor
LRQCHRRAPFLFFNGNTFADVGRTVVDFVFAELPTGRRREVMSAVAHYIAGVLDHKSLERIVNELSAATDFQPGDRVKTMRGSMRGTILRVLEDGRVVWRADSGAELTGLPESLIRHKKR